MSNTKLSYYITCLISGMVELGTIFLGINLNYSLIAIIGLALSYQLGNIVRFFVTKSIARYQTFFSILLLVLSGFCSFVCLSDYLRYIILFATLMIFSTLLQNVRSAAQGNIPRWQKRSCRVIGFVLSAIFYFGGLPIVFFLSIILLVYSIILNHYYYDHWITNWVSGKYGKRVCWAMVTHQAHYFVYNYVMLFVTMKYYQSPFISTIWFAANWIPYTITEPLVHKLKWDKWLIISICAHLFNAFVIFGMYWFYNKSMIITLSLWVLTGFGGGNVFCIKKALSKKTVFNKDVWSFSEQIGHILGVGIALVIVSFCIDERYTLIMSSVLALLTIPIIKLSSDHK